MKIRTILENISADQRRVGQLPADFRPPQTSPQLSGPYPGKNATRGYLVGEAEDAPQYYALVHKVTNTPLSTHRDEESARDAWRGLDRDQRPFYQVRSTRTPPRDWDMTSEGSLAEFAPGGPDGDGGGDDGFDDETLRRLAAQWLNGDEDPGVEKALAAAGWEIGQDEGYDDEPGVFVVQSGDVNGHSFMSWPAPELRQLIDEATGDRQFDDMMRKIKKGTKKQATADRRERERQSREQARAAFGPSPADRLSIRSDKGVQEMDSQGYRGHRGDEDWDEGNTEPPHLKGVAEEGYGNHPSQRVDPRTGKKYVPPKSPLGQGVAEGAKWRSHPDAYDVDAEGNKTPRNPNSPKFGYDPLQRRADTAGDAKTARGRASALKTSLRMARGNTGVSEMDSQGYRGHRGDEDPGKGPEKSVKPAKAKDVAKDAEKDLAKAMDREHTKKKQQGVQEGFMDTIRGAAKEFTRDSLQRKIKQAWEQTFWPQHIEPALNRIQINGQPFRKMVLGEPRVIENKRSQNAILKQYTVDIVFPIDPEQWSGDEIQYLEGQLQDIQDGAWNPKVHGLGLVSFEQPMKSFQYTRGETPDLVIPVRITSLDINRGLVGEQGVSEGSGNNDNNDFYSGLYAELLGDVNNHSVTDMVNTKNSIKRALESGRLSLADVKSEIHQLESELKKQGVSEAGYNPLDIERREQRAMDQERAQFKRDELAAELSGEEQRAQIIMSGTWYVIIDGRAWQRQGQPVTFRGRDAARRAGQTIKQRNPSKTVTITTQLPAMREATPPVDATAPTVKPQQSSGFPKKGDEIQWGRVNDKSPLRGQVVSVDRPGRLITVMYPSAAAGPGGIPSYRTQQLDLWNKSLVWSLVPRDTVKEQRHHWIYESHVDEEYDPAKERERWEAARAQFIRQRQEAEERDRQRQAQKPDSAQSGRAEFVAPHGDAQNELRMFQAGSKPAAVINTPDVGIWNDIIRSGRYVVQRLLGQDGRPAGYVVGQPGEDERVEKIHALVQNASNRAHQGDFRAYENSNYHRWLGRLLGYPTDKIEAFIQNYFRDTPDRARARYDEDYVEAFREALAEGVTSEDVLSSMKRRLGDYLQDVATAIRKDPDLMDRLRQQTDQIGPAVRTLKTDDGHEIRIHGNEDDGFRITVRGRTMPTGFPTLAEAEIATELYCARRRHRDYQPEA